MSRILTKGTQINVPNTVGVSTLVGAATTNYFTILGSATELVEKNPTNVVFVDAGTNVKGAKVGFTN